jgi:hypothetical protein
MTHAARPLWDVHVIEFARSRQQRMAGLIHGAPPDEVHDLPFSFVLARGAPWINPAIRCWRERANSTTWTSQMG